VYYLKQLYNIHRDLGWRSG